jgi:meso-butanediol dehydrogenase/(S,S)-butanediol dehydrogenase/diacetyl reductase
LQIVDRDAEGGKRVAEELGPSSFFLAADVTSAKDMDAMSPTVVEPFGRIDILFNNAGVACVGSLHETPESE